MSTWLDTETKALLQHVPPEKYAPPDTDTFTLVLLEKGNDTTWLLRSLAKVPGVSHKRAAILIFAILPPAGRQRINRC